MAITCQCPNKCEIHPKPKIDTMPKIAEIPQPDPELGKLTPPVLDTADQLQIKKLENEFLKAQLRHRDAGSMVQASQQQIQMFAATMLEKYGLKQEEWLLNFDTLAFDRRPNPAQKG